jgi:hypothetical protein
VCHDISTALYQFVVKEWQNIDRHIQLYDWLFLYPLLLQRLLFATSEAEVSHEAGQTNFFAFALMPTLEIQKISSSPQLLTVEISLD